MVPQNSAIMNSSMKSLERWSSAAIMSSSMKSLKLSADKMNGNQYYDWSRKQSFMVPQIGAIMNSSMKSLGR
jgi:uncharacterized phage infection (PIP) family protein YhgE